MSNDTDRETCNNHRAPSGPCEDLAVCPKCYAPTFSLRPEGETFGFHADDCSLPMLHEGECVGGGSGHPVGNVRGYWTGFERDIELATEKHGKWEPDKH